MEFSKKKRFLRLVNDLQNPYPLSLQFYLQPPTENISLMEFESLAVDRLKLLKFVENLGVSYVKGTKDYSGKLEVELRRLKFPYRALAEEDYDARRKDHISHFILRLAYCQSEELRRWFIQQEMDLFRYRFTQLNDELTRKCLESLDLSYEAIVLQSHSTRVTTKSQPSGDKAFRCDYDGCEKLYTTAHHLKVTEEDTKLLHKKLINSSPAFSGAKVEENVFYKVSFADAVDLVRARRVYLCDGYAYVPHCDIVAIVLNNFRTKLSKALALTARSLPVIQTDERLQPLLSHLSHAYVGPDYSTQRSTGKISLTQIDSLSVESFPPCMRQLHKALRDNHHLRHGGRMQYGLFLKGIGLTLEQALQFWKTEFIRGKVDSDKFDKGYSYSIRHSYGKEGKRTDYTPFSCMKIILSNPPGQGDYHGCPFRHSDPELLKQKLQSYKIAPTGISQILDLVKGMHYQLACQKYFELTHDISDIGFSLNHPNQYFAESQQLLGGAKEIKKEQRQPESSQPKRNIQGSTNTASAASASSSLSTTEEMELEGLEGLEACFAED